MKRAFHLINFKGLSLKQMKQSLTLNEFETLHNQIKHRIVLRTDFLAYRVLKNMNITKEKLQLVTATLTSLNYENLKKQMEVIYDSSGSSSSNNYIKNSKYLLNEMKKDMSTINVIRKILNNKTI